MKRNVPRAKGTYIERDILESDAFWDLNGTAIKVFMVFRLKCRISNNNKNNQIFLLTKLKLN